MKTYSNFFSYIPFIFKYKYVFFFWCGRTGAAGAARSWLLYWTIMNKHDVYANRSCGEMYQEETETGKPEKLFCNRVVDYAIYAY